MKYSIRFLDNFYMLKSLLELRKKIVNVFDPAQEPGQFMLITSLIDERLYKHLNILSEEVKEEEDV